MQFFFSKQRKEKKKSLQFSIFQLQTYIIKYVSSFKRSQDFDLEVQNLDQNFLSLKNNQYTKF